MLRNSEGVGKVYGVDVDKEILEKNASSLKPLIADYLGEHLSRFVRKFLDISNIDNFIGI